jgi:hypothetical protein
VVLLCNPQSARFLSRISGQQFGAASGDSNNIFLGLKFILTAFYLMLLSVKFNVI